MNEKALSRLYERQSNLTRRLLSCIPCDDMIHIRDIMARAKQLDQPILDGNIIKTQLISLRSAGLIRAMDSSHYKRENFPLAGEAAKRPSELPTFSAPTRSSGMTVREEQLTGEVKAQRRQLEAKDAEIEKLQADLRILRQTNTEMKFKIQRLERQQDLSAPAAPPPPAPASRPAITPLSQSGEALETVEDGKGVYLPNVAATNSPEYRAWNNILTRRNRVRPDGIPDFEAFIGVVGYRPSPRSRMVQQTMPNGDIQYSWRQGSIETPGLRHAPAGWPNND